MELPQALRSLVGAPHLVALRTRGPMLTLTDSQRVLDFRSGKPHRYTPKFSDLVAIDWSVVTIQQLREMGKPKPAAAPVA